MTEEVNSVVQSAEAHVLNAVVETVVRQRQWIRQAEDLLRDWAERQHPCRQGWGGAEWCVAHMSRQPCPVKELVDRTQRLLEEGRE